MSTRFLSFFALNCVLRYNLYMNLYIIQLYTVSFIYDIIYKHGTYLMYAIDEFGHMHLPVKQ